jgi:MFS family permease
MMGAALNPINSSIIATALAPIAHDLGISPGRTAVLVASLYVASAVAQPTMGRLAGRIGARRVFLFGIGLVFAGGLLGTVASNLATLTVARVLIGVGTSAGYPTAMLMIRSRAREAGLSAPGRVLGTVAIGGQVTMALGLPLGGLLVGATDWRIIFFVNVPFAVATFLMAWRWIPRDGPIDFHDWTSVAADVDPVGALLFSGTFTALLVFLISMHHPHWTALLVAIGLGTLMIAWELRAPAPLVDLRILTKNRPLATTYLRQTITQFGCYCLLYGVTQWLQDAKGMSAVTTGLVMLPLSGVSLLLSQPVARRNLIRLPLLVGAVFGLAVAISLRFMGVETAIVIIVFTTMIFGVNMSLSTMGNQGALYAQAPPEEIGTAAGLLRTFSYTGAILSSTVISFAYNDGITDGGLHTIATILIATSVCSILMTTVDRGIPARISTPPRPEPE